MRDVDEVGKPEEMLCLGLFSDLRYLIVRFTENETIVGAVLRIREQFRRADLALYSGSRTYDEIRINVLHTDRKWNFVKPYREFEFGRPGRRKLDEDGRLTHVELNEEWYPVNFTLDEDESRWWIKMRFDKEKYPPKFCRKFIRHFRFALRALFDVPVMKLHHTWALS